VELVIAGDDFLELAGIAVFFERDEVLDEGEKTSGFEDAANEGVQFENAARRIATAFDCAPDFEPFLIGGERTDARAYTVGNYQDFVVVEEAGDLPLVGLLLV